MLDIWARTGETREEGQPPRLIPSPPPGGCRPVARPPSSGLNYYGQPVTSPEYFEGRHVANVPAIAGLPPVCSCGWTPHGKFQMSDHLADMGEFA